MEVLRFQSKDKFDVILQTTSINSPWRRFQGRVKTAENPLAARTYAKYSASEPCCLHLYDPREQKIDETIKQSISTQWDQVWPVVFETNKYQITIRFAHIDKGTLPKVKHVRREVEEVFFADEDQGCDNYKLIGTIDFINEPGVFKLEFEYIYQGSKHNVVVTFDVVSPKLDTKYDYASIVRAVDEEYENIVFRYLSLTYQQFKQGHINNDVIWLNTFEGLIDHYIRHVRSIVNRPHTNLDYKTNYAKADRIKRWNVSMEEKYNEVNAAGRLEDYYFAYSEPILTVDSLENRFVKYSLEQIGHRLQRIIQVILTNDLEIVQGGQLADSRKKELADYSAQLTKLRRHPFFKRVSHWEGMTQESLVLQSRQGYKQIYKDWLKLRRGIELYHGAANIGTLQIWEIYELWCFIKMKHLVQEVMCIPSNTTPDYERFVKEPRGSMLNPFLESNMEHVVEFHYPSVEEANLAAVPEENLETVKAELEAHQGDVVTLHYQHTFNRTKQDDFNIHTATTEQRPDIVLNIKKSETKEILLTYLYDAKYRVFSDPALDKDFEETDIAEQERLSSGGSLGADYPPSDAINQMHRYRDAIYYGSELQYNSSKEVIGGYILFPGRGDDESLNRRYFTKSIQTVNIGAFPLTPNKDVQKEGIQLRAHLEEILLKKDVSFSHVKDAIPQRGLKYTEDIEPSPIVLIGYVKEVNIEHVLANKFYYIRAMKEDGSVDVPIGFDKAKYLLLHTNKPSEQRWLFELNKNAQFVSGKQIQEKGFVTEAQTTDMYIGYTLKSIKEVELPNFDKYSVAIPQNAARFAPRFVKL